MTGSGQAWSPEVGEHFGDKSKIPENASLFSISPLGEEIYRMYWMIPCDVTIGRTRAYKRMQLKEGMTLEFCLQCELESRRNVGNFELVGSARWKVEG
ncbi:hypothetical protein AVEN_71097-1 [Araneus ventricosus]|uniref:Uncharacterized protein n=1 Tax=Araneus ventricosus TaxID=182803 RepID=A0A4Y2CB53_ARAVE|nr:hypothetical protein AVEN_71097-1 [Araneus ventricosus]